MNLVITVNKIKGYCPVYKTNDKFLIKDGYKLTLEAVDSICMHSLASIMPYYVALSKKINPKDLGLSSKDGNVAYVQCLDPCDYTGGGTVIFEIRVKDNG
ncbi:MAG: TIGR04076 family protein [Actinomycetota bacterium]